MVDKYGFMLKTSREVLSLWDPGIWAGSNWEGMEGGATEFYKKIFLSREIQGLEQKETGPDHVMEKSG